MNVLDGFGSLLNKPIYNIIRILPFVALLSSSNCLDRTSMHEQRTWKKRTAGEGERGREKKSRHVSESGSAKYTCRMFELFSHNRKIYINRLSAHRFTNYYLSLFSTFVFALWLLLALSLLSSLSLFLRFYVNSCIGFVVTKLRSDRSVPVHINIPALDADLVNFDVFILSPISNSTVLDGCLPTMPTMRCLYCDP